MFKFDETLVNLLKSSEAHSLVAPAERRVTPDTRGALPVLTPRGRRRGRDVRRVESARRRVAERPDGSPLGNPHRQLPRSRRPHLGDRDVVAGYPSRRNDGGSRISPLAPDAAVTNVPRRDARAPPKPVATTVTHICPVNRSSMVAPKMMLPSRRSRPPGRPPQPRSPRRKRQIVAPCDRGAGFHGRR